MLLQGKVREKDPDGENIKSAHALSCSDKGFNKLIKLGRILPEHEITALLFGSKGSLAVKV